MSHKRILQHGLGALMFVSAACVASKASTTKSEETEHPEQIFVELSCDTAGIAKLHTLSPSQVEPTWRDPTIADTAPISLKRKIMRLHDRRIFFNGTTNVPIWTSGSFAHRMAKCQSGKSEVVARITGNWSYNDQVDGYVRIWIDQKPLNLSILSLQKMGAELDLNARKITACVDELRIEGVGDPDIPSKRLCGTTRFKLGSPDTIEFSGANLVRGPNRNLVLLEAADRKLCDDIGPHLDGGPLPAGYALPPSVKPPKAQDPAWETSKTYRVDADNDGEIDDTVILEVDQHVYTGSVLAMFEKDTVFKGKFEPPWWGDLLQASLAESARGGIEPKPLPKEFNWVTNAHDLGGYEAGWLDMLVHANTTYVTVQEMRSMHHHDEYLIEPPPPAAIGTITSDNFELRIVKLTPDERAETVCKFIARGEIAR